MMCNTLRTSVGHIIRKRFLFYIQKKSTCYQIFENAQVRVKICSQYDEQLLLSLLLLR